MGCFQTEFEDVLLAVVLNVTVAVWTAFLPQYAFISFMAATLYYFLVRGLFRPLCEWWYYYALYAVGGVASVFAYIHAWDNAVEYARSGDRVLFGRVLDPVTYDVWMTIQLVLILLTALFMSVAYVTTLKSMLPLGKRQHPAPPASWNPLDRSIEMLATADDVCATNMPHGGLQRLICRGNASAADDLPSYALIVVTYYAMFRRRDPGLAESLLRILRSRKLSIEESFAIDVLEAAYRAAATCDVQALCRTPATGLGALLKELAALHFVYDAKAAERLKCKAAKAFPTLYDDGRYAVYAPNLLLYFIFHATDRAEQFPACQPRAQ